MQISLKRNSHETPKFALMFTINSLIGRGILNPGVAEYRLGDARLGDIKLPNPEGSVESVGGRTRKRALEILQLVSALASFDLGDVRIDDSDGKSERPDFRVETSLLGECDVEVTQLRSSKTAKAFAQARELQIDLQAAIQSDAELAAYYVPASITYSPHGDALEPRQRMLTIRTVLNELFRQAKMSFDPKLHLQGPLVVQKQSDDMAHFRGISVSPPLPRPSDISSIGVVARIDRKRMSAKSYMREGIPLWLVLGITADFGQLEMTVDKAVAFVREILPFQRLFITDGHETRSIATRPPVVAKMDRLGNAWHEAGHAVIGLDVGVPVIETTIERTNGTEMGFTELHPELEELDPIVDGLFTAAGGAAQLLSGFSQQAVVENGAQGDRIMLEDEIARRAGFESYGDRYTFAEKMSHQAHELVVKNKEAVDAVGKALYYQGTLSAAQCLALKEKTRSESYE